MKPSVYHITEANHVFSVTGCQDLVPPDFAWYDRSGDDAVIGCQYRNMTWSLHCDGNRWNGVVGRCNDTGEYALNKIVQIEKPYHIFNIMVFIIVMIHM